MSVNYKALYERTDERGLLFSATTKKEQNKYSNVWYIIYNIGQ